MGRFFIHTGDGTVATHQQLHERGVVEHPSDEPARPWFPIRSDRDASTLWYAVLRKRERGVFIGTLVLRHGDHHSSLLRAGWEEIPPDQIGELSPSPWTEAGESPS